MTVKLTDAIHDFLREIRATSASPHTPRAYASDLGKLARYLNGHRKVGAASLRDFVLDEAERGLKPSSLNRLNASLRSFIEWASLHEAGWAEGLTRLLPG